MPGSCVLYVLYKNRCVMLRITAGFDRGDHVPAPIDVGACGRPLQNMRQAKRWFVVTIRVIWFFGYHQSADVNGVHGNYN